MTFAAAQAAPTCDETYGNYCHAEPKPPLPSGKRRVLYFMPPGRLGKRRQKMAAPTLHQGLTTRLCYPLFIAWPPASTHETNDVLKQKEKTNTKNPASGTSRCHELCQAMPPPAAVGSKYCTVSIDIMHPSLKQTFLPVYACLLRAVSTTIEGDGRHPGSGYRASFVAAASHKNREPVLIACVGPTGRYHNCYTTQNITAQTLRRRPLPPPLRRHPPGSPPHLLPTRCSACTSPSKPRWTCGSSS